MAAIRLTIRRPFAGIQIPFAGMARSYRQLAAWQQSPYTRSPSRHLQPWCARRTLRCAAPPNRSHG